MDNILNYWPLLILFLILVTRLINYIKKQNNVIKKSKADTSTDNNSYMDNMTEQDEKAEFEYDKEKFKERYQNDEEKDTKIQEEKERRSKKLTVKKVQKKSKNKLFVEKEDIIKGIIMKEILDEPRYKKNTPKNQ